MIGLVVGVWLWSYVQMYLRVQNTNDFAQETKISLQNRNIEERLYAAIRVAEAEQRGYLLGGNAKCLTEYSVAVGHVRDYTRTLKIYLSRNQAQYQTFMRMSYVIDQKLRELERTMNLAETGRHQEAIDIFNTGEGMVYTDKIADYMINLRALETNSQRNIEADHAKH